jgi:hypothetical protein
MNAATRTKRLGFGLALLTCLGLTLAFNLTVGYAGDESNHLRIVSHHSETLRPASWEDWSYGTYRGHAYHLFSPVPYAAYIPFHWVQEQTNVARNRITRLGGSVYAIAQFWITWLLVSQLIGKNTPALLATLAVNLIPELRHLHGYVNADSFSILMGTWAFYLMVRMRPGERMDLSFVALIGLALAGLAHSKPTAYPIAGVLFGVFCWRLRSHSYSAREVFRRLGIAICIPLVLAGPFHLHVYDELGTGEWMATATHMDLRVSSTSGIAAQPRLGLDELFKLRQTQRYLIWMSTWGWVPFHGEVPSWLLTSLAWLCALGTAGTVYARRGLSPVVARGSLILGLAPLTVLVTLVILGTASALDVQGRLVLPAGVAAVVFVILGCASILRRVGGVSTERSVALVSILWIALLAIGNLWLLFPDERFQKPESASRPLESHAVVRQDFAPAFEAFGPLEYEALSLEEGSRDLARLDMEIEDATGFRLLQ